MSDDERVLRAALARVLEPGQAEHLEAVARLGPAQLHRDLLAGRPPQGISEAVARNLEQVDGARELAIAAAQGIRYVIPGDDEWPDQLDDLEHTAPLHGRGGLPIGLWAKGPMRLDDIAPAVAIVGSRASTSYGEQVARDIAAEVAGAGMTVVSGGAYGIDAFAHRGAVAAGGATVAVMARGLDRVYPTGNTQLVDHIAATSVVVSEVPIGGAPHRIRFLARNRIVAGLSKGTVVVEARVRSGALNSATWTSELSRPVMAVPGPVTSATSVGTHELVRDRDAQVVANGAEVCETLGAVGEHLVAVAPRAPRPRDLLDRREQHILESVPVSRPATAASIARTAGVEEGEAAHLLARLSDRGFVTGSVGGWTLAETARA